MNILEEISDNLRKLEANETQMSKEQLVRYAKPLKKLRNEIIADINTILNSFLLSGIMIAKDDGRLDAVCREIQRIADDEVAKGEAKRLKDILFQTYSVDSFLNAAYRMHCRIRYEAYATYWISKCEKKPLPGGIPWAGIPASQAVWHNRLIDMYWHSERKVWVSAKETAWRSGMPPTKEECEAANEWKRGGYNAK